MTDLPTLSVAATDLDAIGDTGGRIVVILAEDGKFDPAARRVNKLTRGALQRFAESDAFARMSDGEARDLAFPAGLAAEAVQVVKLDRKSVGPVARKAGAAIGKALRGTEATLLGGSLKGLPDIVLGAALRAYSFDAHRTGEGAAKPAGDLRIMAAKPEALDLDEITALASGVIFARDLTNEPANVLTTTEFADRLAGLAELGVDVEILEEDELQRLGMRALLAVGQGSESPSKVVVMQWKGGGDEAPLALVGKGVVFDTGGISIKPAQGMEEMTGDMGGAGIVAGAMRTIAGRRAKANVVGLVGLVENMPDGKAQRPGDVVRSMKGDTIEVINTDAEGRLVLADVLWYAQERFSPAGVIDLATLTGAMLVALGHENAGVFSNDDTLAGALLRAAEAEGEGAWRMPLGPAYDKMLKSRVADMRNSCGRLAGSITAAQFLKRFVKQEQPWCHVDVAGVASRPSDSVLAPKGATGWGVLTLNRLVADGFED